MTGHLTIPDQTDFIIVTILSVGVVIAACTCLWLVKQIIQIETKTKAINREIKKRSTQ